MTQEHTERLEERIKNLRVRNADLVAALEKCRRSNVRLEDRRKAELVAHREMILETLFPEDDETQSKARNLIRRKLEER